MAVKHQRIDRPKPVSTSALRSEDKALDTILSALEQLSTLTGGRDTNAARLALRRAAGSAVKQALLDRALRAMAITDELTGLYNRRGFCASAIHQMKVARRNGRDLFLFFCDLDDLKSINDSHGHATGDRALMQVSDALKATFRESDLVARYGGDEFTVLASEIGKNQERILSRLRQNIKKRQIPELQPKPSLSVGVARFDSKCPISLFELVSRADRAMYRRKIMYRRGPYRVAARRQDFHEHPSGNGHP
jgi:diguanylate cyclase (GGDEF)-like protein